MDIAIISPSDGVPHETWWADYWVKKDLEIEFQKHGHNVVKKTNFVNLYLFGDYNHASLMTAFRRFCWIYSHPGNFCESFFSQFEHVFVLSKTLLPKIKNSSLLLGASSKEFIPREKEAEYDIIFIGNARKPRRVEMIKHLIQLEKYKICLIGDAWPQKLGEQIKNVDYKGPYVDNQKIGHFFNQGLISFYSAPEDMRRAGFVAVRILDTFKSSENLCISDDNIGLKDIFRSIPTYKDKTDLANKIDWFLAHPKEREETALRCREDVQEWTFGKLVKEIEKWI